MGLYLNSCPPGIATRSFDKDRTVSLRRAYLVAIHIDSKPMHSNCG
jgi:hypothetical protein